MTPPEMTYRSLGKCGSKVSVFGLGGWLTFGHQIEDQRTTRELLRTAYEAGVNFFDTADVYARGKSEELMGRVLAEFPRHSLVMSSKVFFPMSDGVNDRGLSRKHILESVAGSLRRIGTEYLDIYFCHRFDEQTPLLETVRAMDDLVRQGKVLYWGTSEWSAEQLHEAHALCAAHNLHPPQVEQPQYNLLHRRRFEDQIGPATRDLGMGVVCWSPLAMGILTGKYDRGLAAGTRLDSEEWLREGRLTEDNLARVRDMRSHADQVGCSRAQLALAWVAAQADVSSVILGARTAAQLQENLAALSVELSGDVSGKLSKLFPPDSNAVD